MSTWSSKVSQNSHSRAMVVLCFILKRVKKKTKNSSNDDDVDMNLSKELHPISFYMRDRREMVAQMFASLKKQKLLSMLPNILKVRRCSMRDITLSVFLLRLISLEL